MTITGTKIAMVRGDSETLTVRLFDEEGAQVNFETGDTVYFTVRYELGDTETAIQKVITGFTDGEAVVELDPGDTSDLYFRTYVYDIQWNNSEGQVKTIVPASDFKILAEVTYD
jgi:hypothetical protein